MQSKTMKQSVQNIKNILESSQIHKEKITKIKGKCSNKTHGENYDFYVLLDVCKKCKTFVCGNCIHKNGCVMCYPTDTPATGCSDCNYYKMHGCCYDCGKIIKICLEYPNSCGSIFNPSRTFKYYMHHVYCAECHKNSQIEK